MVKKAKKKTALADESARHVAEELEQQFQALQKKLTKARRDYLSSHKAQVELARNELRVMQRKLVTARAQSARAAVKARKSDTATARNELKKARTVTRQLVEAVAKAREILLIAQSRLHAAKPFDRKLAARTRVLEKFEREWEKQVLEEAAARAQQAKQTAAERRLIARQRAEEKRALAAAGNSKRAIGKSAAKKPVTQASTKKSKVRSPAKKKARVK